MREARSGRTREEMSLILQVHPNTLAKYENGTNLPDVDLLAKLAVVSDTPFTGFLEARLEAIGDQKLLSALKAQPGTWPDTHTPGLHEEPVARRSEFVTVPVYDVRAAAGPGALVATEQVESTVAFREDWVRSAIGLPPSRLGVIGAVGDSMYPTICHGDALLLELEPREMIEGAIYAIQRDGELMLKRPQRLGAKGLVLRSDNPAYEPVRYTPEEASALHFVGRVRWVGRQV